MSEKPRKFRSPVWEFFIPGADRQSANCNVCGKLISTRTHPTLGLKKHLKQHKRELSTFRKNGRSNNTDNDEDDEEEVEQGEENEDTGCANDGLFFELKTEPEPVRNSDDDEDVGLAQNVEELEEDQEGEIGDDDEEAPTPDKRRKFRSPIWKYFIPGANRISAKCRLCSRIIFTRTHPTLGLKCHLKSQHRGYYDSFQRAIKSNLRKVEENYTTAPARVSDDEEGKAKGDDKVTRRHFRSPIWEFFRPGATRLSAKCRICGRIISTKTHPTLGLKSHLKYQHGGHLAKYRRDLALGTRATLNDTGRVDDDDDDDAPDLGEGFSSSSPPTRKRKLRAPVWEFYIPHPSKKSAQCRICEVNISTKTHSTLGLKSHMKRHRRGKSLNMLRKLIKLRKEDDDDDDDGGNGHNSGWSNNGNNPTVKIEADMDDNCAPPPGEFEEFEDFDTNSPLLTESTGREACFACQTVLGRKTGRKSSQHHQHVHPEELHFFLNDILELPPERSMSCIEGSHQTPQKLLIFCDPCKERLKESLSIRTKIQQLQLQLDRQQRQFLFKIKAQAQTVKGDGHQDHSEVVEEIKEFVQSRAYAVLDDTEMNVEEMEAEGSPNTFANGQEFNRREAAGFSMTLRKCGRTAKIKFQNQENGSTLKPGPDKPFRYDCPNCPSVKDYPVDMFVSHLAVHQSRPYKCLICSEFLPTDLTLQEAHWHSKHSDLNDPFDLTHFIKVKFDPGKIWKCEACSGGFLCEADRNQHELGCLSLDMWKARDALPFTMRKPYQCRPCQSGFRNNDEWLLHKALKHS